MGWDVFQAAFLFQPVHGLHASRRGADCCFSLPKHLRSRLGSLKANLSSKNIVGLNIKPFHFQNLQPMERRRLADILANQ